MNFTRQVLSAPVVAAVGVAAGALLAAWAGTIALTDGSVTATTLAILVWAELAVVAVGIAAATGGRTESGVDELAEAARDLESGDRSTELPTDREDEVGTVARTMATLVEGLEDAERRAAAEGTRADERTEELQALSAALSAHAEAFEAAMERAAEGDLTARIEGAAEDERLADLAMEFDAMLGNIEETTDRLKRFANDVAIHGEEVTASAEEVKRASEQVSTSVQEISETTETQSRTFERVADRIDELADTTGAIAGRAESVSTIAERTAETGDRGREAARNAAMAMEAIDESSAGATEEMAELEALVDEIDEMAEFISEVAEEVNVLALNANIEASRSPDTGNEGFAVVAKEVKDLAAETKFSAQRIETLVGEVKVQTELSASEVQSTREAVTEGRDTVSEAIDALEEIAEYAAETNDGVQEISAATDEQAAAAEDVVSMVDHAAELSREVDAEAGTVAAAAEQQTSALTEVTQGTEELSREAQSLRDALDRFRTDVEPDDVETGWLPDPPEEAAASTARPAAAPARDEHATDHDCSDAGDGAGSDPTETADEAVPAAQPDGGSTTTTGRDDDDGDRTATWPGDWSPTDATEAPPEE